MKIATYFLVLVLLEIYTLPSPLKSNKKKDELRSLDDEKSDDIIILHTNDVHCGIMDYIGYDGLMLYKKQLQKQYKYVLTVDVGDHIQGGTIGLLSQGIDIIDIMNKLEYDVAILGNHEFDYGIEQLEKCEQRLNCKYISANYCLRKDKKPIYPPYKIVEAGSKKIGFIGVTTPQSLSKTFLHTIVDSDGNMKYDFLTENDGKELYETVQKYIDEVKTEGADYVIILAHLGNEGDALYQYTSDGFLANINGVDAMLDGHTHKVYSKTSKDKDGKNIPLCQTGTKLANIGVLTIKTDGTILSQLISEVPEPDDKEGAEKVYRSKADRWVDSETYEYLNNIMSLHSDELEKIIGYTDFDMLINADGSVDSSKQISRSEETSLCDLVADAIRDIGKGQISIINAGSIRNDIFKGNITYNDVLEVLPFSADIIVKEVKGKDILDALEFGMKDLPGKTPRFTQVSGISFKVDTDIKSPVEVDESEMFVRVNGERRVFDVMVGNEALDANKVYRMSFDNYIANGGDGFSMFSDYEEIESTSNTDNQALIVYIRDVLKGVIPDTYKTTGNRIIIGAKKDESNNQRSGVKPLNISFMLLFILTSLIIM